MKALTLVLRSIVGGKGEYIGARGGTEAPGLWFPVNVSTGTCCARSLLTIFRSMGVRGETPQPVCCPAQGVYPARVRAVGRRLQRHSRTGKMAEVTSRLRIMCGRLVSRGVAFG